MFRNVLVGYEGSERSEDALALALALVGPSGTVTAACTYWWQPLSARVGPSGPGDQMMRAGAVATVARLHDRPGAVIKTALAPGSSPARALGALAEEGDYDLVVVGSTHRGVAGRVLAGTTADALLRRGLCPVAVAPTGYRERTGAIRHVGVAFDGSDPSHAALAAGREIAARRGADLVVLRSFSRVPVLASGDIGYGTVVDEPELRMSAQSELDEAVASLGSDVPVTGELLDGDPGSVLVTRSAALDLLVLGSKGHSALGRFVLGSVSHHVMCNAATPVIVVPPAG